MRCRAGISVGQQRVPQTEPKLVGPKVDSRGALSRGVLAPEGGGRAARGTGSWWMAQSGGGAMPAALIEQWAGPAHPPRTLGRRRSSHRPRRTPTLRREIDQEQERRRSWGRTTSESFVRWITPCLRAAPAGSIATNCCKQPCEITKKRRVVAAPGAINGHVTNFGSCHEQRPGHADRGQHSAAAMSPSLNGSLRKGAIVSWATAPVGLNNRDRTHRDRSLRTINYVSSLDGKDLYKSTDIAFYRWEILPH